MILLFESKHNQPGACIKCTKTFMENYIWKIYMLISPSVPREQFEK